ncbi:MAG TPA: hypothetical protein VOA87_21065 [Thermoanaerobaculia bacterium]|nr:hypothetical protein [Thermoanaerobaculia bacterium]
MEKDQRKAISEITALQTRASELDNDIATDDLKFSVWIAAIGSVGFGLVLLNGDKIIEASWLARRVGSYLVGSIQVMLAASIICAGLVHYLIDRRLYYERAFINLLNAQLARVLSDQISAAGEDIGGSVVNGMYLRAESRESFNSYHEQSARFDRYYHRLLRVQLILAGIAYAGLLIVGLRHLM